MCGKNNTIMVGGIYREHSQLGQGHRDLTKAEQLKAQEDRWSQIVRNWKLASLQAKVVVLGDINLDHRKWDSPEQQHETMVEVCQNNIDTAGFSQLITEITRSFKGQTDSILYHIWVNCKNHVINHFNVVRSASDHNVIGLGLSIK